VTTVSNPAWKAALAVAAFTLMLLCLPKTGRTDLGIAVPLSLDGGWIAQGHDHAQRDKATKHKDHDNDEDADGDKGAVHGVRVPVFGPYDREIITGYYHNPHAAVPPGLAKRGGDLPPGLERQLQHNGTLPPGLQKRLQPLPYDLSRRLPPLPTPYTRGIIGTNVILLDRRTGAILDVVRGVTNLSPR
jgi:hypothetical protein